MSKTDPDQLTRNFRRSELACKCGCGRMEAPLPFIEKLQELRDAVGGPLIISSGWRCPAYNQRVSSTGPNGPHTIGAVDIPISGQAAHRLLQLAIMIGFTGIGFHQRGPHKDRFIHLDDLPAHEHPRPWVWSY